MIVTVCANRCYRKYYVMIIFNLVKINFIDTNVGRKGKKNNIEKWRRRKCISSEQYQVT
jgi:hypothetical protein